jgi:N-acetyl-beta-hexosaminidase
VWTEFVTDEKIMQNLCFPRWFAVAEIAWNSEKEKEFPKFLKTSQFFCEVLNEMGITAAPEKEWNILPHTRLSQTLGFAAKNITKRTIIQFFRGNK